VPTVRAATPDELPQVGATLAAAFADDPVWSWMAPPSTWAQRARGWFAAEAKVQLEGQGVVLVDDQVRGAAMWSPPDRWKTSPRESVAMVVPSLRLFRTRTPRALRMIAGLEGQHPAEPAHWYLAILGTDPSHQGHGIGSALVSAVTDRCDTEGLPAYLESSKEQNVPFYARHGFVVRQEIAPAGSPPLWTMWREPR
jgi:GNAT superfamily N-acetyltransferase